MGTPAAIRVWSRELTFTRRIWKSLTMAAFFQPLLYLLGVGVGVGALVDAGPGAGDVLGGTSYFAFYATALFATTAMFTSAQESLWPTLDGFQWTEGYFAMVTTPLTPDDVLAGITINHAFRTAISASGLAAVLLFFDDTRSIGLIPAVAGAVVTGLAFALPITGWTARCTTDRSFPTILRFGIIPMFLFGGAFYPVEQLPGWLQPLAWITPLWHGVELCRGAVLGGLEAADLAVHLAVLALFVGGGWVWARRGFHRRLAQ